MLHLPLSAVLAVVPAAPEGTSPAEAALALLESRGQTEALLAAISLSGVAGALTDLDQITLLAPTDAAFSGLPQDAVVQLFEDRGRAKLQRILAAHVIPGALDARALLEEGQVTTLGGVTLQVELRDGRLFIGGAAVSDNDLRCEGGVVHELAGLIVPASAAADPVQRLAARALDLGEALDPAGRLAVHQMALAAATELGATSASMTNDPEAASAAVLALYAGAQPPAGDTAMNDRPGTDDTLLMDFAAGGEPSWFTLNDDVMGGISQSAFERLDPSLGVFKGALSLENNGGFATIRSASRDFGLAGYRGLRVRLRGDGREYGLSALGGDERGRSGAWRKKFTPPAGEWTVVDVPFEDMVLNIRGRRFPDAGPPDPEGVRSFSFIIADKDETPFRLEIDWIAAYR